MELQVFAWLSRLLRGREDMAPEDKLYLFDILDRAAELVGPDFDAAVRKFEHTGVA